MPGAELVFINKVWYTVPHASDITNTANFISSAEKFLLVLCSVASNLSWACGGQYLSKLAHLKDPDPTHFAWPGSIARARHGLHRLIDRDSGTPIVDEQYLFTSAFGLSTLSSSTINKNQQTSSYHM
jgi:hypothetical protein